MSIRNQIGAAVVVAVGTLCATQIAFADHHVKSGSFEFLTSFVTDYTEVEQSEQTVTAGSLHGTRTITKSGGGPWAEGSSQTVVAVIYITKSSVGIDLIAAGVQTDSSGDKVFITGRRTAGDIAVGGGGKGIQTISGGTGKYEGITGTCEYTVDYLPENRIVTIGTCDWQRN